MKDCPNCGLIDPDGTIRCDCGYNFDSGKLSEPPTINQPLSTKGPKLIAALGVTCILVGVGWPFLDEWTHFRFSFLSGEAFFIPLLAGILLSASGIVVWAHHSRRGKKFRIAGYVLVAGVIAFVIAPGNVHGPGMLLVLVALCAFILSLVLALMAATTRIRDDH